MFLHPRSIPGEDPEEAGPSASGTNGTNAAYAADSEEDSSDSFEHSVDEFHFGMTTEEEIDQAVAVTKEDILKSVACSDERRRLVRRLVELRLQRLDLREAAIPLPEGVRVVRGHTLQPQRISQRRVYCHVCSGLVVLIVHRWYNCQDCDMNVHSNCLEAIPRNCAAVMVRENPVMEFRCKPERSLAFQGFRCFDCSRPVMIVPEPDPPLFRGEVVYHARQCDYNGNWYCTLCHWNDKAVSPARIVHNWHFHKTLVSCGSREYLQAICNKPVIHLEQQNPRLFDFLEELRHIKKLREEVLMMKQYFLACRAALQSRILLAFGDRQYFVETSYLYSLRDVCQVPTGELLEFLLAVHAKFAKHIREECEACRGKGHICEVCSASEVLFAFDAQVMPCPRCQRVMHQHCYVRRDGQCPRCARLDARRLSAPDPRSGDGQGGESEEEQGAVGGRSKEL